MIKEMKTITCILATALMLGVTSLPVQAGTLTIHNKNCTKTLGFETKKRITVHVWGQKKCKTGTNVTVRQGQSKTITLDEEYKHSAGDYRPCRYYHEAWGTTGGKQDVLGSNDSSVTCKKDWAGVCQCILDI